MSDFLALIAALGIRPIRVPDLQAASILLEEDSLILIATELTPADRSNVLDAVLAAVTAQEVTP